MALLPAGSGQEASASPLSPLSDAMCLLIPHAAGVPGMAHHAIHSNNELDLLTPGRQVDSECKMCCCRSGSPICTQSLEQVHIFISSGI